MAIIANLGTKLKSKETNKIFACTSWPTNIQTKYLYESLTTIIFVHGCNQMVNKKSNPFLRVKTESNTFQMEQNTPRLFYTTFRFTQDKQNYSILT